MSEPITRDEDADAIVQFHSTFRAVLIRHRASRLQSFFLPLFPDDDSGNRNLPTELDPTEALDVAVPESIRQHKLFMSIGRHVNQLMSEAGGAQDAAAMRALTPECFRGLKWLVITQQVECDIEAIGHYIARGVQLAAGYPLLYLWSLCDFLFLCGPRGHDHSCAIWRVLYGARDLNALFPNAQD